MLKGPYFILSPYLAVFLKNKTKKHIGSATQMEAMVH